VVGDWLSALQAVYENVDGLPLATDALTIDDNTPNPLTITAQLNRD
jgi:hypothetical protein